ncbi:MAG: ribosome-associated protein [Serratia symbiotica]|nr:ribosome-associated protein [Serratia symbiotica]
MKKQPKDYLYNVPMNAIQDKDERIWVSKSEIKRNAEAVKDLGAELVDLGKNALERMPLDEDLRTAIELAQKIKKEGRRRQLQLIGRMLRTRYVEPIQTALGKLKKLDNQQIFLFNKLAMLSDRLVEESDDALPSILGLYPEADCQKLRSLVRNVQKEQATNKPPKAYRQIFQYLRNLAEITE